MDKPKPVYKGNVTKKGELSFPSRVMTALRITSDMFIRVARVMHGKQSSPGQIFLEILSDAQKGGKPFSRVGPTYGIKIPNLLDEYIPDYKAVPHRFMIQVGTVDGIDGYLISFEKGKIDYHQ